MTRQTRAHLAAGALLAGLALAPPSLGAVAVTRTDDGDATLAARAAGGSRTRAFDLAVVRTAGAARKVAPTDRMLLSATVRNRGTRRSAPSRLRFVVTRARRPRATDAALATNIAVPRLRPGRRRVLRSLPALVPPTARRGAYRVFACVAARPPAREARRANNCGLVGRLRVRVAAPLDVSPIPAAEHAVSATIDAAGGTLEAKVPDGSVVRLTLPAGAVNHPVTVRLVPLARLERFRVRGATGLQGAQIEPAGLVLEQPARLDVTRPGRVPSLAFSFGADGDDAHLVPFVRAGGFAALVTRFGGYAVASAATPARAAARVPLPADPANRIEQAIARVLVGGRPRAVRLRNRRARAAQVAPEEIRALMTSLYLNLIRPELVELARSEIVDPEVAFVALRRLLVNLRQAQLLGVDDALSDADAMDASELMQQIVRLIFDGRIRQCKRGNIRTAVGMVEQIYRQSALPIGIPPYAKLDDEVLGEDWRQRAAICLNVGIRFDLNTQDEYRQLIQHVSWGERASATTLLRGRPNKAHPEAQVPPWRTAQPQLLHWVGTAAVEVHSFAGQLRSSCSPVWGWSMRPTTLEVEIVPHIEEFSATSPDGGYLEVRFREHGGFHIDNNAPPDRAEQCRTPDFAEHLDCLSDQRGESGDPDHDKDRKERWYPASLRGGTVSLAEGGPFPAVSSRPCFLGAQESWRIDGLFQITPLPPP